MDPESYGPLVDSMTNDPKDRHVQAFFFPDWLATLALAVETSMPLPSALSVAEAATDRELAGAARDLASRRRSPGARSVTGTGRSDGSASWGHAPASPRGDGPGGRALDARANRPGHLSRGSRDEICGNMAP